MMLVIGLLVLTGALLGLLLHVWVKWLPQKMSQDEAVWRNRICAEGPSTEPTEVDSFWDHLIQVRSLGLSGMSCILGAVSILFFVYWERGLTIAALVWVLFFLGLLALAAIDFKTKFLPDAITLPLLWIGLFIQIAPLTRTVGPEAAILGAVMGYVPLWILANLFRVIRKREGLGYGDLKLLAAIGAWMGPTPLPWIIFIAAVLALIFHGLLALLGRRGSLNQELPFGPWIVTGAFLMYWLTQGIQQIQ